MHLHLCCILTRKFLQFSYICSTFTASKTDRHLLSQKVCRKISVIITNTCVFARVFSSFCWIQDKTWIKMPKWTIFLISSEVFVLITESFWQIFWAINNCRRRKLPLISPFFITCCNILISIKAMWRNANTPNFYTL